MFKAFSASVIDMETDSSKRRGRLLGCRTDGIDENFSKFDGVFLFFDQVFLSHFDSLRKTS